MADVISSAANPLIKRMRLLSDRKHRRREGAFVVQGVQPVWQAVEAGADIEALIVAPDLLSRPATVRMVAQQEDRGLRVVRISSALFSRLADRDGPSGLAAIVRARLAGLADLRVLPDSVFVALHEVGNPGNLGTIIRTANAAGAAGVVLIGATTDPFDPAAVRATMGALFSVPVAPAVTAEDFFTWAAGRGITVAAASARGTSAFWESEPSMPLAILLGSEGRGLPASILAQASVQLRIPMVGTAESLNLAVAAGILMYETVRKASSAG
jgi:TrmH family RNA methyltransferase